MGVLDEFFPFDLGHGYPANTARWRKMAQLWQCDGVLTAWYNPSGTLVSAPNVLSATLAGATLTVQPGGLFLHGYYGEVQTAQAISITGSGTGTVVAGVDLVAQTVSIYYRDAVTDYGTGGFEQDTSKWEMPLWGVSGATTTDLRTWINSGSGSGWWGTAAGPVSVATSATVNTNVLTLRVPYAGTALIRGELLLTFTDASIAQSAICQLTYQFGLSDVHSSATTMSPRIPGAGSSGSLAAIPVALSGQIPVTQGKKTLGWTVTAGTGTAAISLTQLTVSAMILNLPAVA